MATLAVQGADAAGRATPVVQPLVQSVTFLQDVGSGDGLRYPRYGNVPKLVCV